MNIHSTLTPGASRAAAREQLLRQRRQQAAFQALQQMAETARAEYRLGDAVWRCLPFILIGLTAAILGVFALYGDWFSFSGRILFAPVSAHKASAFLAGVVAVPAATVLGALSWVSDATAGRAAKLATVNLLKVLACCAGAGVVIFICLLETIDWWWTYCPGWITSNAA